MSHPAAEPPFVCALQNPDKAPAIALFLHKWTKGGSEPHPCFFFNFNLGLFFFCKLWSAPHCCWVQIGLLQSPGGVSERGFPWGSERAMHNASVDESGNLRRETLKLSAEIIEIEHMSWKYWHVTQLSYDLLEAGTAFSCEPACCRVVAKVACVSAHCPFPTCLLWPLVTQDPWLRLADLLGSQKNCTFLSASSVRSRLERAFQLAATPTNSFTCHPLLVFGQDSDY